MIHAAKVEKSPRLKRVLAFLRERGERGATGREIVHRCDVTGLEAVRELRANGFMIDAKYERMTEGGAFVWRYKLVEAVQRALFVVLLMPWPLMQMGA